ncbi:MAG: molybdopterin-dependent oxidoreductase, partial [Actinomycetota bacterium]|nr:molybdopterin-dependent oxidoreductase [Actinomycetota bacterium]
AKARGATVIHVDPRFTRTSALADIHVPIRAGSDIAFLGGIVNHILSNGRDFREYVAAYTNASALVDDDFADTEDLDGLFSGFDPGTNTYDPTSWQYEGAAAPAAAGRRQQPAARGEQHGSGGANIGVREVHRDPTLTEPRCVYQILKRHFARYTPEMVEQTCGVTQADFLAVAEALCANSGRERTSAFVYSVGWTHHTVGVQYIRAASILQLLLGNMGRPGGGILALRGHASIQGSTDIPTLYDLLPGYLPMPHAGLDTSLATYVDNNGTDVGFWGHMDAYTVSLLKAYWGDAATADNDYAFGWLPRITGDHSTYQSVLGMIEGSVKGYFVVGENPATGTANGRLQRAGLANLDWLVVRDFNEIETASFWHDGPEIETGEMVTTEIGTEVFLMPAAAHTEKDGSFTNTQRLLQWHNKAVEPQGATRSDLWFYFHLGRIIRDKLAASTDPRDEPVLKLTWDYPTSGPTADPSAEAVLAEINGRGPDGPLSSYTELKADGSTTSGCWIYTGVYAEAVNQAARRRPGSEQNLAALEWGWAWPANRRILYNRASADPHGRPWSERKAYVWWDAPSQRWTGEDIPDFVATKAPEYRPGPDDVAEKALGGDAPFIMQSDGMGWLYAPNGLSDGPLPAHYEPHESPVPNPLYRQQSSPTRQVLDRHLNRSNPPVSEHYPYVFCTYRLTEHHTAGAMSRNLAYLSELQPEFFCEVSPALAAEKGLTNGGWPTIITARNAIEARVLVTERMRPLRLGARTIHQVGLPYHWGWRGLSTGDPANDLLSGVLDANVHIPESKVATCDIWAGRRPRGPALPVMVARHLAAAQEAAGVEPRS